MKNPLLFLLLATHAMAAPDYAPILPRLDAVVHEQMRDWDLRGVAVALVDDQRVVHEQGYGEATKDSVFRAGSISKLFNAIGVMQQVEAGRLDLDAPLPPEFTPVNPFADRPAVTLRHLLSHRSGLQREARVGHYFDDTQPTIEATARSVHDCVLVTRPGEKTRYSNVAPTIAGHLAARAAGKGFESWQKEAIFSPLGMSSSAWTLKNVPAGRLVPSHMRVADGRGGWRRQEAPVFDLGTIPAGNLFTTVGDLARFASCLLADGRGILRPGSLAQMLKPQFTTGDTGFGLGFSVGKFRQHPSYGHNGAVFGHSAYLTILPDAKVAVVAIGNEDIANGRLKRIGDTALSLLLEAKTGEKPPASPDAKWPEEAMLRRRTGDYESQSYWAHLAVKDGRLTGEMSGQPLAFRPLGGAAFEVSSRIDDAVPVTFTLAADGPAGSFVMGAQKFERVPAEAAPLPAEWKSLTGAYGPAFIPVIVSERHGHLYAMTENMVDYRLTPVNRQCFALPPGMYVDEHVVFLRRPDGTMHGMDFANMVFTKHP